MAIHLKGILGGFSGLIGTVVGSRFRKREVMRSRPVKSSKPAVESQIDQRSKFGMMMKLLSAAREFINLAFSPADPNQSPMNAAMRFNANEAIIGVSPNFSIDYSKIVISNGKLNKPTALSYTAVAGGKISVTWDIQYAELFSAAEKLVRDTDQARLFLYSDTSKSSVTAGYNATRIMGALQVRVPFEEGEKVHAWILFVTADLKNRTASHYLGSVTILE